MERRSGHTGRSDKPSVAFPYLRLWHGALFLAVAAILVWLGATRHSVTSPEQEQTSAPARDRNRGGTRDHSPSRPQDHTPSAPGVGNIGLPPEIEQYLEAFEDEQADGQFPSARDHIGSVEFETLVLRFPLTKSKDEADRILALLSDLQKADALTAAKALVLREDLAIEDPVLLACATSLAKNGRAESIEAICERLNQVVPDESGEIPDQATALMHSISLVSAPEMEWFIGQAAEGKWIASSTAARMAAIRALSSYPSVHTTSILARLRDHDASPFIRDLASEVLSRMQSQDAE